LVFCQIQCSLSFVLFDAANQRFSAQLRDRIDCLRRNIKKRKPNESERLVKGAWKRWAYLRFNYLRIESTKSGFAG
jgi:hypothetical protein